MNNIIIFWSHKIKKQWNIGVLLCENNGDNENEWKQKLLFCSLITRKISPSLGDQKNIAEPYLYIITQMRVCRY
jgi:hypothetical protein